MSEMVFKSADPIIFDAISNVTATPRQSLGDRIYYKGEEYVYCYNAGGSTCAVGNGVKPVTGASGYSIAATSLTDTANPCVGVVKHTQLTTATYGWVMVKGYVNVRTGNSAITGDYVPIGLSNGGGFGLASGPGTNALAGFALNVNTASAGTFYAFIRTGA